MHGTGNDFLMIDNFKKTIILLPQQITDICKRNFGVGADGVILVEPGKNGGDCFMNYINADGSFAEMCGNGARCTADFMVRFKNFKNPILNLETYGGIRPVQILKNHKYTVNMGKPEFAPHPNFPSASKNIGGTDWHFVSMGNPHAVGFFDSEMTIDEKLEILGEQIENNTSLFPRKINVNFVAQKGENHFIVKTYERGSGPTLSCGTGASASFSWIIKSKKSCGKIQIDVPGGELFFEYNGQKEILMTGSSKIVFSGKVEI